MRDGRLAKWLGHPAPRQLARDVNTSLTGPDRTVTGVPSAAGKRARERRLKRSAIDSGLAAGDDPFQPHREDVLDLHSVRADSLQRNTPLECRIEIERDGSFRATIASSTLSMLGCGSGASGFSRCRHTCADLASPRSVDDTSFTFTGLSSTRIFPSAKTATRMPPAGHGLSTSRILGCAAGWLQSGGAKRTLASSHANERTEALPSPMETLTVGNIVTLDRTWCSQGMAG